MIGILFWILFSIIEGIREGGLFSNGNTKHKFDIHNFLIPTRILIMLMICYFTTVWLDLLVFMFVFSFFHNGFYYETRKRIDIPTYNFFSQSTTTTAKISFNFPKRLMLLIIGIILWFIIHYYKLY